MLHLHEKFASLPPLHDVEGIESIFDLVLCQVSCLEEADHVKEPQILVLARKNPTLQIRNLHHMYYK